jgi:hypothetical protein
VEGTEEGKKRRTEVIETEERKKEKEGWRLEAKPNRRTEEA